MRSAAFLAIATATLMGCATAPSAARSPNTLAGRLCATRVMLGQVDDATVATCMAAPDVPRACVFGLIGQPGVHQAFPCSPRSRAAPRAVSAGEGAIVLVTEAAAARVGANPYDAVPQNPFDHAIPD